MKNSSLFAFVAISFIFSHALFAEETETTEQEKHPVIAVGMSQFSNLFLFGVNRYVRKADYATGVDFDSMRENLESPWVWDQDEFSVNQIGHPYQGSFYFVSGRANGLSFGQSALVTLGGSAVWELFYETETPSKNDIITTSMGGMALGEMLHRLYSEAYYNNFPLAFVISPMDALSSVVTQSKPERMNSGITKSGFTIQAGILNNRRDLDGYRREKAGNSVMGNLAVDVIYGDPFGLDTDVPFTHFELHFNGMFSPNGYSASLFSDGALFSRAPIDDESHSLSLGASLHYDVIYSNDINFSANAVGFTLKSYDKLTKGLELSLKLHLNWLPLATSDYIFLRYGNVPAATEERRDYDMGTGVSAKADFAIGSRKIGTFNVGGAWYGMTTIPASVPDGGSEGLTSIAIVSASWEHFIAKNLSSGVAGNLYLKNAQYKNAPDVSDQTGSVSLILKYFFL